MVVLVIKKIQVVVPAVHLPTGILRSEGDTCLKIIYRNFKYS
jgi:hypothetical protein